MMTFNDFDGLALFVRIVQAGGLAAAERATGIPKATLSRRLTALEEALHVRLARRTRKGIVLTEEGQHLFDRGQAAFQAAEQAVAEVQSDTVALAGNVRLSLPPDIATACLAPALIRFQADHPGVSVEITLDDRRVSLVEEGYDLVVRMGPVADSDLMFRKVADLPRLLVAAPGFMAQHGALSRPEELARLPALSIRKDQPAWILRHGTEEVTLRPAVAFAANRQSILVQAACQGLGFANLPEFLITKPLASGALVPVLPDWSPLPVEMNALWQRDRITGRLIKAIVAAFQSALTPVDEAP